MREALRDHRLIRRLAMLVTTLDLDRRDFVIFGSGPLLAHGLRTRVSDLDVVARGRTWELVSQYGFPSRGKVNGARMASFWGGLIQFSPGWISADWQTDDIIENAEFVDGMPFARLTEVLRYKKTLGRPKDRHDVALLERRDATV